MPRESRIPDGPLLVVAPEMGDAALSCGALLDRADPLTVLDVFTSVPEHDRSTDWDHVAGFESATAAMVAREHEEAAAFADSRHEVVAVDLLSRRYRDGVRGERDERRFRRALDGWVSRAGACTVVLPAGAGRPAGAAPGLAARVRGAFGGRRSLAMDPDHLWVRDTAATILRSRPEVHLWLYEELPHLESCPADRAVELFARWCGRHAEPVVVRVDRKRKANRLARYTTLVPARLGRARRLDHRLPATERYWRLQPSA